MAPETRAGTRHFEGPLSLSPLCQHRLAHKRQDVKYERGVGRVSSPCAITGQYWRTGDPARTARLLGRAL